MPKATIYHNPRCSKSRQTLALLEQKGVDTKVIEYLKTPLSVSELKRLAKMLGLPPIDFVRKKEQVYQELKLNHDGITVATLFQAMHKNPILIERPIVVIGDKAVLGRPPENVLKLL